MASTPCCSPSLRPKPTMNSPPPSSSDTFPFSPAGEIVPGPEEEVEALLAAAEKVVTLDDNLARIVDGNKTRFLDVFGRQLELLKSRSQAFEDAHVTVYDKVLLALTKNGNHLDHPAAIAWYCAEYLGVNTNGSAAQNAHVIDQVLDVSVVLTQALNPALSREGSDALAPTSLVASPEPATHDQPQHHRKNDPIFNQFWSVYSKARAEYLAIAANQDNKTLEAAKFLRDTAENGVHYMQNKHPKDPVLTELVNTLTTAKKAVLDLNGGRKRKFDNTVTTPEKLTPHTAGHNRAHAQRRRQQKGSSGTGLGRFGQKRQHVGRGASGIPYGYSRPVDSYHPT